MEIEEGRERERLCLSKNNYWLFVQIGGRLFIQSPDPARPGYGPQEAAGVLSSCVSSISWRQQAACAQSSRFSVGGRLCMYRTLPFWRSWRETFQSLTGSARPDYGRLSAWMR